MIEPTSSPGPKDWPPSDCTMSGIRSVSFALSRNIKWPELSGILLAPTPCLGFNWSYSWEPTHALLPLNLDLRKGNTIFLYFSRTFDSPNKYFQWSRCRRDICASRHCWVEFILYIFTHALEKQSHKQVSRPFKNSDPFPSTFLVDLWEPSASTLKTLQIFWIHHIIIKLHWPINWYLD